jgi:hypothetical protein
MYKLNDIKPIQLNNLIRIGQEQDGGYVLSESQLNLTDVLLSFGINEDWSFDTDFLKRKKDIALFAYDYSISDRIILKHVVSNLIASAKKFLVLDFRASKQFLIIAIRKTSLYFNFCYFFTRKKNRFFFKKFLGSQDDDKFISVSEIFRTHVKHPIKELSVFVKMDIEESEYLTLHSFTPFFHVINGFAIEFHKLDIYESQFTEIIKEILADFYVAHIHANNYGNYIAGTSLPDTLEITFINKKVFPEMPALSQHSYPIDGLDFPCNKALPDIPIIF